MPPLPWLLEYLACFKVRTPCDGLRLHAYMVRFGLDELACLASSNSSTMVATGCSGTQGSDKRSYQDWSTWSSLILDCVASGKSEYALALYQHMQQQGFMNLPFLTLLKACIEMKNLEVGQELHVEMMRNGVLRKNIFIGSTLINMYTKCGSLAKAQEVLADLPHRNLVSWTTLVAGYAEHGDPEEVFNCVQQMQCEGIIPDAFTIVYLLKACGTRRVIQKGQQIHFEITSKDILEDNIHLGSSLVSMYMKCGFLEEAQKVFDSLLNHNVVSWTTLITGYAEQGYGETALYCLEQMQREGVSLNAVAFVCSLKACANLKMLSKGRSLHLDIVKKGFERDQLVGNTLIDLYGKSSFIADAQKLFDNLAVRSVTSWNIILSGYAEHQLYEKILCCYAQMEHGGISPNAVTFTFAIKASASIGAKRQGQELHSTILKMGLEGELAIGSILVDMYSKWGSLTTAVQLFEKLAVRDVVSWNVLLEAYAEDDHGHEILYQFEEMQREHLPVDEVTYTCTLKACGSLGALDKGQMLHMELAKCGMEGKQLIGNTVIDMYAKCGSPETAQKAFDMLQAPDLVSWNTLASGYLDSGYGEKALCCLKQMQQREASCDQISFLCSLKACGAVGEPLTVKIVHAEIVKRGFEHEPLIGSTLIDTYAKFKLLAEAQQVFDKLLEQTVVSWNVLAVGYIDCGQADKALCLFEQMQGKCISFDVVTLICGLKACACTRALYQGQKMHAEVVKQGFEVEHSVGNVLMDMYAKCGLLEDAQVMFDKLVVTDVVAWTSLIVGYAESGLCEQALVFCGQMQQEGVSANAITLIYGLNVCGKLGATMKGADLHMEIVRKGIERELLVGNSLVDFYAECGLFEETQAVFDGLLVRDAISWNALMAAYAQLGEGAHVFSVLKKMVGDGFTPDSATLASILNACTHTGLVAEGHILFEALSKDFGLVQTLEHYTCLVDLLCRAGSVDKMLAVIAMMPLHPDIAVWHVLLGACQRWAALGVGQHAFTYAQQLDANHVASYVFLSNIYADTAENESE